MNEVPPFHSGAIVALRPTNKDRVFRSYQDGVLCALYSVFKIEDNSIFSDLLCRRQKSGTVSREAGSFHQMVYFFLLMLQSKGHEKPSLMVMSRFFHL